MKASPLAQSSWLTVICVSTLGMGPLMPCFVDYEVCLVHITLHPLLANLVHRFLT